MLVLLRMAIGWHFLFEGLEKIFSTSEGRTSVVARILPPPLPPPPMEKRDAPFSAETYLRNATGPLGPFFRDLVPDVYSKEKLNLHELKSTWDADLDRFVEQHQLTPAQLAEAEKALLNQQEEAESWFRDTENVQKIRKYFDDLAHVLHSELRPPALEAERTQVFRDRTAVEADRRSLVQTIDGWTEAIHGTWRKLLSPEQLSQPEPQPWTRLDWINAITKYGLAAVGACLLLGLFTMPAALGAAVYLAMFYLSMPPWPGLPPAPMAEGHYLFVNKNLIEMLACLVLAGTPTGYWVGLDALFFGWLRRRQLENQPQQTATEPTRSSAGHRKS
jgi:uncharacterized membrane protein YphA (DoxX/SURF4 family)